MRHLTFLIALIPFFTYSQTACTCAAEMDVLYENIRTMSYYQNHISGKKTEQFKRRYEYLRIKALQEDKKIPCFILLTKLLEPIKNNSVKFEMAPYDILRVGPNDPFFIEKQTFEMKEFAKYNLNSNINTDSLENVLSKRPENDIEGIYHKNGVTIGLYKKDREKKLEGVVLNSQYPNWIRGNVILLINETDGNRYNAIEGSLIFNVYSYTKNERFDDGRLVMGGWYKSLEKKKIIDGLELDSEGQDALFDYKEVADNIEYVKLKSLISPIGYEDVNVFLDRVMNNLHAGNIIVDLRGNSFSVEVSSKTFFKFIKKYAKKNNVYLLVNGTVKNVAERYIADLKEQNNVFVAGELTAGMLMYGYESVVNSSLSCKNYTLRVGNSEYSEYKNYEDIGIEPDYILRPDTDWVEQTINIIQSK